MYFGNLNNFKEHTYKLITGAASYPITKTQVKDLLKLDASDTSEDDTIDLLIAAVTDYAEKYTRRDFINKTYRVYLEYLPSLISIRKSKLQSIVHIKYYDQTDVQQTLSSSIYAFTDDTDYSRIYQKYQQSFPTTFSTRPDPVEIQFVAGYGADATYVPNSLKLAMLQHVASMYANRGDCTDGSGAGCDFASALPPASRMIYNSYKIYNINARPMV